MKEIKKMEKYEEGCLYQEWKCLIGPSTWGSAGLSARRKVEAVLEVKITAGQCWRSKLGSASIKACTKALFYKLFWNILKGNISCTNQFFRVNRANFNLNHRITIQGACGDWVNFSASNHTFANRPSHSPCAPPWMLIWWPRLKFARFPEEVGLHLICSLI